MNIAHSILLEEKLKEIQRIKSEFYVGTKSAYEYLNIKQRRENNQALACNIINSALIVSDSYLASPERIYGINKIFINGFSFFLPNDSFEDEEHAKKRRELLTFFENYTLFSEAINLWGTDAVVQYSGDMTDCFKKINSAGISADRDAFYFVRDKYISQAVPELQQNEFFDVQHEIGDYSCFDEKYRAVNTWLDRYTKCQVLAMGSAELLKKDCAEGVFQFRRPIIDIMLAEFLAYTHVETPDKQYEKIIMSIEDSIKIDDDLASPKANAPWPEGVPYFADESRFYRFVRFLFGSEKSYVMKFIRAYHVSSD